MRTTVTIENMKSLASASRIQKIINNSTGITNVSISIAYNQLSFDYTTHNVIEGLRIALSEIGYPITQDPYILNSEVDKYQNSI